ncbi:uncharacterized protein LOC129570348 [Sitodiplosis mosellana]|uniref:uncharacterized protein LOC129570348 n=1 Tax=Sitodiplosis mosellana TaxID=263140 RepID=UPI00244421FF|nr:uncharacterized protein LOC129570348 [Sitodiplosis mosellana]
MSVDWGDQLDEMYRAHQANIEDDLRKMVNMFATSVDESPSKEPKVRRFFESLCHTVSTICSGVRAKNMDDKPAHIDQASVKTPADESGFSDIADENDMKSVELGRNRRDSDSSQSEWSTQSAGHWTQSDWPVNESIENKSNKKIDTDSSKIGDTKVVPGSKCSTPLVSEFDIDCFLDFQRARTDLVAAQKRKCSEESDEFQAKKSKRFMDLTKKAPYESKRNPFMKSKQNHFVKMKKNWTKTTNEDHTGFKNEKVQLSNDAALRLRSRTSPFLDAEVNSWNKIRTYCYFCERKLEMSFHDWTDHLLMHTGEEPFYCTGCNVGLPKFQPDHCVQHQTYRNIKGGNVTAYICNKCDYIQFNMHRVVSHIMDVHMRSEQEAENSLDKVVLIPDLRSVPRLSHTKYNYVSARYRYGCGIKGCNTMGNSNDQFTTHFTHKHADARMFSCPHCKEIITNATRDTKSFINTILKHYNHHNDLLNQCTICDTTFYTDFETILHILTCHTDGYCNFRREFRAKLLRQDVVILFECNMCHARLEEDPIQHHLKCHHSHHANFKLIQLVKETDKDNVTKFSMVEFDENILFQQHFACGWCHETLTTKAKLIRHHIVQHRSSELSVEFKNYLTRSSYTSKLLEVNSSFDQYLIYLCDYCDNTDPLNCLFYSDVKDVYNHWSDNHGKKENPKPFRFTVTQLVECHHCRFISTFFGLKIHHAQHHSKDQFAIRNLIDRSKCGLCLADHCGSFTKHFENDHKTVLKANLFNPIALDDDTLMKLRNLKGMAKRKCLHCFQVFETKTDFKYHHARKHSFAREDSEKFHDNESIYLVTGCCQETIKPTELFEHLRAHDFSSKSRLKKFYWNTLAIFGNGLILEMAQLSGTEYDQSDQLHELIKEMKAEK